MKLEQLRQKLLAAARASVADERVPYAFEKRILALLAAPSVPDLWALWSRALWRAAVPCVVVMLVFGAVSFLGPTGNGNGVAATEEFSQDFEQAMLAVVDQSGEVW
jgi:capsule polysaccharide export protein KpsE/RkpR